MKVCVNTGFNKFAQSLIVWSCHASCTLPSAGLRENKLERCKFNKNASCKMVCFFLKPFFPLPMGWGRARDLLKNMEYTVAGASSGSLNGKARQPQHGLFEWRSKLCPRHRYLEEAEVLAAESPDSSLQSSCNQTQQ